MLKKPSELKSSEWSVVSYLFGGHVSNFFKKTGGYPNKIQMKEFWNLARQGAHNFCI